MPKTEILLLRHAQSTWNAEGRWQGQADPPLSDEGRVQAAALAARLADAEAGLRPAGIYASDLTRAVETARAVARDLGLEPRFDARLREWHVGEWAGHTPDVVKQRWPEDLARLRAGDLDVAPGGGESGHALMARVRAALGAIAAAHPDEQVVVVTHLGVARSLVPGIRILHGEWTWLVHEGDAVRVRAA